MAKPKIQPEVQDGVRREEENTQETSAQEVGSEPVAEPVAVAEKPLLDVEDKHPEYVRMVRSIKLYPLPHVADPVNRDMVEDYRLGGWMFEDELPEDERPTEE